MNAGWPPSPAIVIVDIPGAVDAKPDTVERIPARVPANALKVVAHIFRGEVAKEHCLLPLLL